MRKDKFFNSHNMIGILIIIAIIGIFGLNFYSVFCTQEIVTISVTDKERVIYGSGEDMSSKYLIFTTTETFENTDSLLLFKYNSSDIYGRLERGKQYKVLVYGFRSPVFSVYRNIVKIIN